MSEMRLKHAWWRDITTHPAVGKAVGDRARRIASASGRGYEASSSEGQKRYALHRASVITVTRRAMRDNARHNTLLRNINA